mmetsp:Transcript_86267/g.222186  ORF Transcript_86267/g.222186 Transcript_86267/m.222186 type:complete len:225 (-) Transcript_86267:130-804(-)
MGQVLPYFVCCCEADATRIGLDELRKRLVGQRKKVQTNPQTEPEVFVTIQEVKVTNENEGHIKFSPKKFTLRDLNLIAEVEVLGTATELAALAAAKGAAGVMEKMRVSHATTSKVLSSMGAVSSKANRAKESLKNSVGLQSKESRRVHIDVVVDLVKELGVDEVGVTIKQFHTDIKVIEKVMTSDRVRRIMEETLSAKASEAATRRAQEVQQKAAEVFISPLAS